MGYFLSEYKSDAASLPPTLKTPIESMKGARDRIELFLETVPSFFNDCISFEKYDACTTWIKKLLAKFSSITDKETNFLGKDLLTRCIQRNNQAACRTNLNNDENFAQLIISVKSFPSIIFTLTSRTDFFNSYSAGNTFGNYIFWPKFFTFGYPRWSVPP